MGLPKEQDKPFSYKDYKTWPEDERWELIDGRAFSMSPAPGRRHQELVGRFFRAFSDISDKGGCETYISPFDVRLPDQPGKRTEDDDDIFTVVQPDLMVFCSPEVLDDTGAHGPPDLVMEVLSPSTSHRDLTEKLALYEKHGVREYWLVNGEAPWVMVYKLGTEGRYGKPDYYLPEDEVTSRVLGGAEISLKKILS